jgi:hypothetical protein
LGLDLGLIERLQQAFSDQPPHENQLARVVQIARKIADSEPFRRQRMAHRRSGMQRHGDLVAMETQDERLFVLIYQIGKERPATDNTVEADIADLRQRFHLVSQKRGTPVDEAFHEAPTDFIGIDFRREAPRELGERLAEGAAVAIWPGECGRQRRADLPVR